MRVILDCVSDIGVDGYCGRLTTFSKSYLQRAHCPTFLYSRRQEQSRKIQVGASSITAILISGIMQMTTVLISGVDVRISYIPKGRHNWMIDRLEASQQNFLARREILGATAVIISACFQFIVREEERAHE